MSTQAHSLSASRGNTTALASYAQAILRVVAAYLLLTHASAKLFHVPHIAMFDGLPLFSLLGAAGVIELVGGVLVLLGFFTRAAAFVLSGELAFAYFIGHVPQGHFLLPLMNQGEPAMLMSFIFLFIAAAGPGAWSIDGRR
ncbi:INTEGRAL MEMBRANE PROTEIN (Rhomboid family) [Candidatus Burkholderia verschuerenii]|uniref:INTEGRAL MEMBRANE PROTEIN (Rhomboid family) n=1 Tax=Candidatus Burkholderia verschuerenii TaxID=242163 RepID=A0A0L0MHG1_9BURK|nr:DoxX family protein [Candidatus Burkholderia verschuerenii]KND61414.1 INTEGRAL MEMBRANE PROTEIN (Rhomboid family) [Candidatus Burkholderia verschuerenii]